MALQLAALCLVLSPAYSRLLYLSGLAGVDDFNDAAMVQISLDIVATDIDQDVTHRHGARILA